MSRKLSLSVPDQMNAAIEEMVERGIFSSKTAVIEEGLRMLFAVYEDFSYPQASGSRPAFE